MERFYQLGLITQEACNWEEAIKNYISCLNTQPGHIQARIHLGQIYIQINNLDEALIEINKALELNPAEEEARVSLGLIYLLENKLDLAEKIFTALLLENPDNFKANLGMGWVSLRNEAHDRAESYLKKYDGSHAAKDPYFNVFLELIGNYYFNKGKYALAEFWYEKIVQLEPNNFNCLRRKAMSYFFQKKHEKVLSELEKIKSFDLKSMGAKLEVFIKAMEYYCQKKYDTAIDILKKMPAENPADLPEYYLFLGKCYLAKGDLKSAEQEFANSLRALPDFIHAKIAMEELSQSM